MALVFSDCRLEAPRTFKRGVGGCPQQFDCPDDCGLTCRSSGTGTLKSLGNTVCVMGVDLGAPSPLSMPSQPRRRRYVSVLGLAWSLRANAFFSSTAGVKTTAGCTIGGQLVSSWYCCCRKQ